MQEKYILFICTSGKLNSLWQSTSERRKQQTSADFAGGFNITPHHETWKIQEKD